MNVDTTAKSPPFLSLCPGLRGLERGIERATGKELDVIAYVEIEAWQIWNLVSQMEQGVLAPRPVFTDVKAFAGIARRFRGKVWCITGGYPCPPFSIAGQRKGTEDPRHLFPYFARIADATRAPVLFFENVAGHLTLGYREVRLKLESMGYTVTEGIFSAAEVGAPHERERLFILAVANPYHRYLCDLARRYAADGGGEAIPEWHGLQKFIQSIISLGNTVNRNDSRPQRGEQKGGFKNTGKFLAYPSSIGRGAQRHTNGEHDGAIADADSEQHVAHAKLHGPYQPADIRRINEDSYRAPGRQNSAIEPAGDVRRNGNTGIPGRESTKLAGVGQADAGEPRFSRCELGGTSQLEGSAAPGSAAKRGSLWPAGPGQPQYEWEAPRVIESGMGCTINGYNHREDLLRGYGNAVVEQTAELAWPVLWRKILKTVNR